MKKPSEVELVAMALAYGANDGLKPLLGSYQTLTEVWASCNHAHYLKHAERLIRALRGGR